VEFNVLAEVRSVRVDIAENVAIAEKVVIAENVGIAHKNSPLHIRILMRITAYSDDQVVKA
jgi:hypothetical protein